MASKNGVPFLVSQSNDGAAYGETPSTAQPRKVTYLSLMTQALLVAGRRGYSACIAQAA